MLRTLTTSLIAFIFTFNTQANTKRLSPNGILSQSLYEDTFLSDGEKLSDEIFQLLDHNVTDCDQLKRLVKNEELSQDAIRVIFEKLNFPTQVINNLNKEGIKKVALVGLVLLLKSKASKHQKLIIKDDLESFLEEAEVPFTPSEDGTLTILGVEQETGKPFEYSYDWKTLLLMGAAGKAIRTGKRRLKDKPNINKDSLTFGEINFYTQILKMGRETRRCNDKTNKCMLYKVRSEKDLKNKKGFIRGSLKTDRSSFSGTYSKYKTDQQLDLELDFELPNGTLAIAQTTSQSGEDGTVRVLDVNIDTEKLDLLYKEDGSGNRKVTGTASGKYGSFGYSQVDGGEALLKSYNFSLNSSNGNLKLVGFKTSEGEKALLIRKRSEDKEDFKEKRNKYINSQKNKEKPEGISDNQPAPPKGFFDQTISAKKEKNRSDDIILGYIGEYCHGSSFTCLQAGGNSEGKLQFGLQNSNTSSDSSLSVSGFDLSSLLEGLNGISESGESTDEYSTSFSYSRTESTQEVSVAYERELSKVKNSTQVRYAREKLNLAIPEKIQSTKLAISATDSRDFETPENRDLSYAANFTRSNNSGLELEVSFSKSYISDKSESMINFRKVFLPRKPSRRISLPAADTE